MQEFTRIIERYRQADEQDRIYLFLDCPQLRDAFMEIDRQVPAVQRMPVDRPCLARRIASLLGLTNVSRQAKRQSC